MSNHLSNNRLYNLSEHFYLQINYINSFTYDHTSRILYLLSNFSGRTFLKTNVRSQKHSNQFTHYSHSIHSVKPKQSLSATCSYAPHEMKTQCPYSYSKASCHQNITGTCHRSYSLSPAPDT